jgi:hypothetical protein
MMSDAAAYTVPAGILTDVNLSKCVAMPTLSAAISCTGPAELGAFFSYRLMREAKSFDDLVSRGSEILPRLFMGHVNARRAGDAISSIYLIGWHEKANRPAAYAMDIWTDDASQLGAVLKESANSGRAAGFKLTEMDLGGTPMPAMNLIAEAGFVIHDDNERFIPEVDLLHLMEVQRHERIQGRHWVGGKALLTSIDRSGVTQKIIHTWSEDRVGEPIEPRPIDWQRWRAERAGQPLAPPTLAPAGAQPMSRQQRRALERERRKSA